MSSVQRKTARSNYVCETPLLRVYFDQKFQHRFACDMRMSKVRLLSIFNLSGIITVALSHRNVIEKGCGGANTIQASVHRHLHQLEAMQKLKTSPMHYGKV